MSTHYTKCFSIFTSDHFTGIEATASCFFLFRLKPLFRPYATYINPFQTLMKSAQRYLRNSNDFPEIVSPTDLIKLFRVFNALQSCSRQECRLCSISWKSQSLILLPAAFRPDTLTPPGADSGRSSFNASWIASTLPPMMQGCISTLNRTFIAGSNRHVVKPEQLTHVCAQALVCQPINLALD